MAVFGLQPEIKDIEDIVQYQAGRYISSNEAVWRILSFPIHERSLAVVHLAVHLQKVNVFISRKPTCNKEP